MNDTLVSLTFALGRAPVRGALVAWAAATACADGGPAPEVVNVTAPQEPIAVLTVPAEITAGEPVLIDGSASADVDGTIVGYEIRIDDDETFTGATATVTFASAGLTLVELVVTDDQGQIGRARTRVSVAPPRDALPPLVTALDVTHDGAPVGVGDVVIGGALLTVALAATDLESAVATLDLVADGLVPVLTTATLDVTSASATFSLPIPDASASYTLVARAIDRYDQVAELTRTIDVLGSLVDEDGDGLPDALDPDPARFNGASASLFVLDEFPRNWLGDQLAEDVEEKVRAGTPAWSALVPTGFLVNGADDGAVGALFADVDAVSAADPLPSELWALSFQSALAMAPGAHTLTVSASGDDVVIVYVNGTALVAADEEYALNLLRTDRLPTTADVFVGPGEASVEILVANEAGPAGFAVTFAQSGADGIVLDESEVTSAWFFAPESP